MGETLAPNRIYPALSIAGALVLAALIAVGCRSEPRSIKVVVFDVGGVLSKDMIDTKLTDLATAYGLDVKAVLAAKGSVQRPCRPGRDLRPRVLDPDPGSLRRARYR